MSFGIKIALALAGVAGAALAVTSFQAPPVDSIQRGYRGVGMVQVYHPATVAASLALNQPPAPEDKQDPAGQPSSAVYSNVQVLKDLDANEFLRLMAAITNWVAPKEGCSYCHADSDLASDSKYTKVVARRMLQMVQRINGGWKDHVAATGVTCYTCHRGQPVPMNIWFDNPDVGRSHGLAQEGLGKDKATSVAASAALPSDVFTPFLEQANDIRVVSAEALPGTDRHSIKQTEWTYGLMMHFSQSLGVNCTYCHNSRSFTDWSQSTPQRVTAWYGIRMVRDLNNNYLDGLAKDFPANRLGPTGDGPKLNCATCHMGAYKPLFGANMVKDYPELEGTLTPVSAPAPAQEPAPAPAPAPAPTEPPQP